MSLSYIERLPTELIQPIFLASGPNLALPLASHYIAAKLSHKSTYNAVCTQYLKERRVHSPDASLNRTRLFASRWMTWEYFKSFLLYAFDRIGCLCGMTAEEGCFDAQWPPNFEDATTMTFNRCHCPALTYVKCRLPVKLLHGPWTQDKVQFLLFLLWTTSMTVDWANPEVSHIAREGKKQAFLEKNLEAVQLFNHNRRLGRSPNLDSVRFAVIEAGCGRSIIYDTMASARLSGLRGRDWNCAELDEWCKERIEAGDPKGTWLKVKLQELRQVDIKLFKSSSGEDYEREIYGEINSETGDYNAEGDTLVINDLQWNKNVTINPVQVVHPGAGVVVSSDS
ncbi:hypothetical protein SLS60_010763 [Paraconiothyrium brasiliense]|uniref:Uncharacterized protein n=1 Tax=Paraconiothyrium brasiliense TaxID=300254 RepID=A0ABR3QLX5_9PLEO